MRKRYWLAFGAGLGAVTGLAVVGLAYLGEQALALPFIPFVFFDWLARVLPGSIITLGIDSMVRIIVGLGLGPIDVVAKAMEQALGIFLWLVASAAIGVALAAWLRRPTAVGRVDQGTGQQAGAFAGLGLALLVVIAMLSLRQFSTTYYTGARLRDVLEELGLRPTAKQLALQSVDGFYESVQMQDMQDPRVLLVYGMNGTALPVEHGYPLRIYIPNRYGMKQPKWITSMEAIDHDGSGYWVDRGWSKEAHPQVISIIDTVAKDSMTNGRVPVGGIAWAGDRSIKSVEVQVDGGAWSPANLITPPVGPLTWVQWRFDWPVTPGRHTFRVRATDGKGALQNGQDQDTYPNGATGYHAVTVDL